VYFGRPFLLLALWLIGSEQLAVAQSSDNTSPIATQLLIGARLAKPLSWAEELAVRPLDAFKECDVCPEMVVMPTGTFLMGSPEDEKDREDNESPQHSVTFANVFAVGRGAVTFDEWDACVAEGGCRGHRPSDNGWGRARRPVVNIWWDDAKAYTKWLAEKTGKNYRLLTEAEREYVTRAGTLTPFWWGTVLSTDRANYDGDFTYPFEVGLKGIYRGKTLPVDHFDPNPWGLFQVHGNVYEWVEDCWHPNYRGAPIDGRAWEEPNCNRRMLRGGAWNFASWHLRAASRGSVASILETPKLFGMRVARTIEKPKLKPPQALSSDCGRNHGRYQDGRVSNPFPKDPITHDCPPAGNAP
jgi:formylglycine-generating enzyme required for sulfatase activity